MLADELTRDYPSSLEAPITRGQFGIVIATLMWADGTTRIDIAIDESVESPPDMTLAFDGEIQVPSRVLALTDTEWTTYWRRSIGAVAAHVRVWVNHLTEPDRVIVHIQSIDSRSGGGDTVRHP
jgi:hypothetical protein